MKKLKNKRIWEVWYYNYVDHTYEYKRVKAVDEKTAFKKARIKKPVDVLDLVIVEKKY